MFKSEKVLRYWTTSSSSKSTPTKKRKTETGAISSNNNDEDSLPYLSLRESELEDVLKFLLFDRQFRVEVWMNKASQCTLLKKGSPGNLEALEEFLPTAVETKQTNLVMAVKITSKENMKTIGISAFDSVKRTIIVSNFPDNVELSNLEVRKKRYHFIVHRLDGYFTTVCVDANWGQRMHIQSFK